MELLQVAQAEVAVVLLVTTPLVLVHLAEEVVNKAEEPPQLLVAPILEVAAEVVILSLAKQAVQE
jgi:hypothetical protein